MGEEVRDEGEDDGKRKGCWSFEDKKDFRSKWNAGESLSFIIELFTMIVSVFESARKWLQKIKRQGHLTISELFPEVIFLRTENSSHGRNDRYTDQGFLQICSQLPNRYT